MNGPAALSKASKSFGSGRGGGLYQRIRVSLLDLTFAALSNFG